MVSGDGSTAEWGIAYKADGIVYAKAWRCEKSCSIWDMMKELCVSVRVFVVFAHRGNGGEWLDYTKNIGVNHISSGDPLKAFRPQSSKVRFVF